MARVPASKQIRKRMEQSFEGRGAAEADRRKELPEATGRPREQP